MSDIETLLSRLIEISEVKMPGGWRGWVAVRAAGKERFSKSDWITLLSEPEKLLDGVQETLKSGGCSVVAIKYLASGGRGVKAVLKRHRRGRGVREFFRSLGAPRAMRNFIAAVRISQYGLPVAAPLAAVYRRRFLSCEQSIYISEYVDGVNLYEFLKNLPRDKKERYWIMSRLSEQIAEIFAVLDKKGLWHRDAKATNFIVSGHSADDYQPVLTDMDGIKQYSVRRKSCQMRALWQLAASVMGLAGISRTDYLRMFRTYCEKTGIPVEHRRELLRELIRRAQAKHRHKQGDQVAEL
jgi:hypothetical protein